MLVADGLYDEGNNQTQRNGQDTDHNGTLWTRAIIDKPLHVTSVNGPDATIIRGTGPIGADAARCVYVGTGAVLSGFTLENGATLAGEAQQQGGVAEDRLGGGVYGAPGAVVSNCIFRNNSAAFGGGGAYRGALFNCSFVGNSARFGGGSSVWSTLSQCVLDGNAASDGAGAHRCTLTSCSVIRNNAANRGGGTHECLHDYCTLTRNFAKAGGGAYGGALKNSIIRFSNAPSTPGSGNWFESSIDNSCTVPMPASGTNNITDDPQFTSATDFTLSPESPCVDAGVLFKELTESTDVTGAPRVTGSSVDMGAYEFRFEALLRTVLLGPLNPSGATMQANLTLPLESPYAADRAITPSLPSNAVDWVLIELNTSIEDAPNATVSAILRNDGRIVMPDGSERILLESKGLNYLTLRHRNHLAVVTPNRITTNRVFQYDFTAGSDRAHGGANALTQAVSGVWSRFPAMQMRTDGLRVRTG